MSSPELSAEPIDLVVAEQHAGLRLDFYLAQQFPTYSRVLLRKAINAAGVRVAGKRIKASYHVNTGDQVSVALPPLARPGPQPEDIPLTILYEDEWLVAINKPPGMVVHPAKGHWSGTLTSALQHHFNQLSSIAGPTRPGVVHRLDRDTSGVIVAAKSDRAHLSLGAQFEQRLVQKSYFAIVVGQPDKDRDVIELPIGFHPHQREKMAVRRDDPESRAAQSFYEVIERFDGFAVVRITPKTGRTHQIRVHLASIDAPVLADKLYGGRDRVLRGEIRRQLEDTTLLLDRQALHAERLELSHPETGQRLVFEAPLPDDLLAVLTELRTYRALPRRGIRMR